MADYVEIHEHKAAKLSVLLYNFDVNGTTLKPDQIAYLGAAVPPFARSGHVVCRMFGR